MLPLLVVAAHAAPVPYHLPNSTLGLSVGTPAFLSVRGEVWQGRHFSTEIGGGVPLATVESWLSGDGGSGEPATFDGALRWRPGVLCFGCRTPVQCSVGLGLGTVVTPNAELVGPWRYAVGPDVAASLFLWFTPTLGMHVTGRAGGGPGWEGDELGDPEARFWGFGTVGFTF